MEIIEAGVFKMADHDRTDRVPLAAGEPRCEPSTLRQACWRCARYSAVIPQGTPLGDYSRELMGGTVLCPGFVSLSELRKQANQRPAPGPKTWPTGEDVI